MIYNKLGAIKYLCNKGPRYSNEWTEAGMYHIISDVIHSKNILFTTKYLEKLIDEASNF